MDAKISKDSRLKSRLTRKDFHSLKNMIRSAEDDLSIAVSNIKNLKYSFLDIKLLCKTLAGHKRRMMQNALQEAGYPNFINDEDLKFKNLHAEIKKEGTKDQQEIFEYLVENSVSQGYAGIESFSFIDTIKTKIRW
tara:strand:+ start:69 stop:476 length:408 start_codon:yes stop_codon:yes gene_type:complete